MTCNHEIMMVFVISFLVLTLPSSALNVENSSEVKESAATRNACVFFWIFWDENV